MDSQSIKQKSKVLSEVAKAYGYEIKHSHALEIVSKIENGTHWHLSSLNNPEFIKTGVSLMDKDLGGGLKRGTLTSIVGKTNSGKSILCYSIACNAMRNKQRVVIYSLDCESREDITNKLLSNLSNISYSKILNESLSSAEKSKIDKIKKNILDKLLEIRFFNSFDVTIEHFKEDLFNLRQEFKFDLIVIDSGQLISTENKKMEHRISQGIVFKGLSSFSRAYDCAVISSVQSAYSVEKEVIRGVDISESIEILRRSNIVITLNINDDERKSGKFRLYLDKSLNNSGKTYSLKSNFPTCNLII
jgi:replicative DNA helicase